MKKPTISINQTTDCPSSIFKIGNWLIHEEGRIIVVVTKDDDDIDTNSFEGFCIEYPSHLKNYALSPNWSKRQFKEFTGTITITR